jgi:hypothetical protein
MKENSVTLEISDVLKREQEEAVIEAVRDRAGKTGAELSEYFKATDSITVEGLPEAEAAAIRGRLEPLGVTVRARGPGTEAPGPDDEAKREAVACPRCGCVLESLDWRCPDCFYEFPEYEYRGEE